MFKNIAQSEDKFMKPRPSRKISFTEPVQKAEVSTQVYLHMTDSETFMIYEDFPSGKKEFSSQTEAQEEKKKIEEEV